MSGTVITNENSYETGGSMTGDKRDGSPGLTLFLCEQTMYIGRVLGGLFIGIFAEIHRTGLRYVLN